ncbi:hypothetical protein Ancab_035992 [Ancistrocladus abbreviatus]
MEGAKEVKRVCKLCNRSFPCGRSLGGHMRSHLINSSEKRSEKFSKEKLKSISSSNNNNGLSYELRENPKKTWRVADLSEEDALLGCKECGRVFQSPKALFGHMKSHSEKERVSNSTNNSLADHGSWASVQDSQSDNEESEARVNRLRRSSRRRPRYMGSTAATTTTSSSLSFANDNNANNTSSSVSEIEQEQEEVALCLIMLSRDVGQWGGGGGGGGNSTLNSVAESNDNNSLFLGAKMQFQGKKKLNPVANAGVNKKLKKLSTKSYHQSEGGELELSASGYVKNGAKMHKVEVFDGNDREKESKLDLGEKAKAAEVQLRKNLSSRSLVIQGGTGDLSKVDKSKIDVSQSAELENGKLASDALKFDICKASDKRTKFECTTCNKVFHSYQALGGHRASHKRMKSCSSSKPESTDNSLEIDISPADSKLQQAEAFDPSQKTQKHECPICFKVFSSGQALGGHKRSHLIGEAKTSDHPSIVIRKSSPEFRDLLDLNLPAPVEDEASNAQTRFKQWWHEPLLGLMSN